MTLFLTWAIYNFFIIAAFGAGLPSMFTFEIAKKLPFSNVKQLLDSDFTTYGSVSVISTLNVSLRLL
jgi:hypothetical protein